MLQICNTCQNDLHWTGKFFIKKGFLKSDGSLPHRHVSSPAILSLPENTGIFFFRPKLAGIFFWPEFADILFRSDIADIFFPTQNCRHIFRPEIRSIISNLKLPAFFFDLKLGYLNLHILFFYQSNNQGL